MRPCCRKHGKRLVEKGGGAEVSGTLRHLGILRDTRLRGFVFPKSGHRKCRLGTLMTEEPTFSFELFPDHLLFFL